MRFLIEIPAADVENAGLAIDMALPAAWITAQTEDAEAYASTDGRVVARLSRTGRADIVVRGNVTATVDVPCARCLKPTTIDVEGELALLLKPNPALVKTKAAIAGALRAGKIGTPKDEAPKAAKAATEAKPGKKAKAAGKEGSGAPASSPSGEEAPVRHKSRARAAAERAQADAAPSDRGSERGGKAARIAEYEFSAEEAEHDEYDGDTIVLDGFVREAILLELPNFPLCSETCAGISPRLSVPWGDAPSGSGASTGAPIRANPFEALKHLAGGLPKGPELGAGASENGAGSHFAFERAGSSDGNAKKRGEPKLASTHSVPIRKGASKKKSAAKGSSTNGPKKPAKPTKH